MARYISRYPELGFYVNGEYRKFTSGHFDTEDAAEIAVLDGLSDAERVAVDVDEAKEKPEESAEPVVKAAPKPRKSSAK